MNTREDNIHIVEGSSRQLSPFDNRQMKVFEDFDSGEVIPKYHLPSQNNINIREFDRDESLHPHTQYQVRSNTGEKQQIQSFQSSFDGLTSFKRETSTNTLPQVVQQP
jgi:hypothetical protein